MWNRPAVVALAIGLTHLVLALASADPGVHSGGDNAAYVALANSLAQGGGHAETWSPGSPPHTKYPPLYPGALALLILAGAKTWSAFKAASAVFTGLAAALCFLWVARLRGPRAGAAVALLFAVSPAAMDASQWILSEPLFLALTFGALWLLAPRPDGGFRAGGDGPARRQADASARPPTEREDGPDTARTLSGRPARMDLTLGLTLAAAAWFTRSAGLPLIAAAALWLALSRSWRPLALFGGAFAVVALPWQLRAGGDYVSEFRLVNPYAPDLGLAGPGDMLERVLANVNAYALDHIPAGLTGWGGTPAALAGLALAGLAAAGWIRQVRPGPGAAEIFCLLYAGLILIWPVQWSGGRFALPLLPPALFYAGDAAAALAAGVRRRVARQVPSGKAAGPSRGPHQPSAPGRAARGPDRGPGAPRRRPPAVAVAAGALVLAAAPAGHAWLGRVELASRCATLVEALGPFGCRQPPVREFQAMALWARGGLPPGSIVFSRKPRIFHAFSGHASVTYPFTTDAQRLLAQADSLGAGYVVLDNWDGRAEAYVRPSIAAHPERFCVVARLQAPARPPILMLEIVPPPAGEADADRLAATALRACPVDSPAPSRESITSMTVPILERP